MHALSNRHQRCRLQKRFGNRISESFASAGQHEIAVEFPKQLERDELINFLRKIFQLRNNNSISRAQPERDPLRTFHFVRQIFG